MQIIPPDFIVEAYSEGYFPMGEEDSDSEVAWYSARKRGIMPINEVHIPKRVLRRIRTKKYTCRLNTDFEGVISGCAARETTWINDTIHNTFVYLHQVGLAHSVEVWQGDKLCGGLYGLSLGGAYFAESIFQNEPECMKMALHFCHQHLIKQGFLIWDVQFSNPFLEQFGCTEISEKQYKKVLKKALEMHEARFV